MAITYCTVADVRNIINPNGTVEGVDSDSLSDAKVETHIERAESLINSYLGSKYTTPFLTGNIPPLVKTVCIDIAAYYCLYVIYSRDSQNINDWVLDYYNRHIDKDNQQGTLNLLRNGDLVLLDINGNELPRTSEPIESNNEDYHPTFDVDAPENWTQDTNKLDDIANERASDY
jgi:phage gp36-like protein